MTEELADTVAAQIEHHLQGLAHVLNSAAVVYPAQLDNLQAAADNLTAWYSSTPVQAVLKYADTEEGRRLQAEHERR
uniref:hypothetical protein n=1 Tax=Herbidospora sakaeratensis TaxID=564415 RepID=UPI0007824B29|nr:hypothetical protein [Herbidospora sakaeratensis]